ncbi:hypothetical protein SLH49_14570 [Cognatiyoonia sp. IB215446]|uniref:hypothetical protein n=1 Tax=Cognatiyoonia sp. IB215446 TaxID=3097355 RepID=UPI002A0B2DA0|nr:hypothetical protein [Cognatiyoonia sp. IB215446]MDX8349207.1 hypothetical protein [Cognatiyoonia sp. IB215446]
MSDHPDTQPADQKLDVTLQELMPELEQKRRTGLIFAAGVSVVAIALSLLIWASADADNQLVSLALVFVGVVILFFINGWVTKGQQRMVLPHLAKAIDLEYEQNGRAFLDALPARLLPKAGVRRAEDCISGTIDDRPFALAEVKFETGGKNSRTLFRGIVVRFQNAAPIPAFFIAPERKTGGWFSRMNVDDLVQVDSVTGQNGEVYGVWLSQHGVEKNNPALRGVIDLLTDLETQVGDFAQLFSATSTGEEMHIALSHFRDMFAVGGLRANREKIMAGITDAFEDLNVPLRIVSALLQVERASGQSE